MVERRRGWRQASAWRRRRCSSGVLLVGGACCGAVGVLRRSAAASAGCQPTTGRSDAAQSGAAAAAHRAAAGAAAPRTPRPAPGRGRRAAATADPGSVPIGRPLGAGARWCAPRSSTVDVDDSVGGHPAGPDRGRGGRRAWSSQEQIERRGRLADACGCPADTLDRLIDDIAAARPRRPSGQPGRRRHRGGRRPRRPGGEPAGQRRPGAGAAGAGRARSATSSRSSRSWPAARPTSTR